MFVTALPGIPVRCVAPLQWLLLGRSALNLPSGEVRPYCQARGREVAPR